MVNNSSKVLVLILKERRLSLSLTLRELSAKSRVSTSHLGRIEKEERFPSAEILRKIAKPLGFEESELFTLAGFLSPIPAEVVKEKPEDTIPRLDPYVAKVLAEQPLEVQRSVIGILTILKSLAKSVVRENPRQ